MHWFRACADRTPGDIDEAHKAVNAGEILQQLAGAKVQQ